MQWNPVNTTTLGPKKFGRINGGGLDTKQMFFLNDVMANGVRFN